MYKVESLVIRVMEKNDNFCFDFDVVIFEGTWCLRKILTLLVQGGLIQPTLFQDGYFYMKKWNGREVSNFLAESAPLHSSNILESRTIRVNVV